MSVGITLEELLDWNDGAAVVWKNHLDINPELLSVHCDIGGTESVQQFVRHIWGAELRWAQRLAALTPLDKEKMPAGPLDELFDLHRQAVEVFRNLLSAPEHSWVEPFILTFDWIPPEQRAVSRRKIAAHALIHSQRHYAQLATLARIAGFTSTAKGDLLFSPVLG